MIIVTRKQKIIAGLLILIVFIVAGVVVWNFSSNLVPGDESDEEFISTEEIQKLINDRIYETSGVQIPLEPIQNQAVIDSTVKEIKEGYAEKQLQTIINIISRSPEDLAETNFESNQGSVNIGEQMQKRTIDYVYTLSKVRLKAGVPPTEEEIKVIREAIKKSLESASSKTTSDQ